MTENKILIFTVLNLFIFIAVAAVLGGDAINGHTTDGRFYLANHGQDTEVSLLTYRYSLLHSWLTILSFAGLLIVKIIRPIW